ncbi:RagB/SusD family nutrient uptake outer membrane protein [uncultured Bacteroides sp.]|uniref:RagB/SusD family nutrient uptake outer membrane protein n=1 Tax=uncultured Bacteroides sp. TaxID=162156 RepID=UPI0025F93EB8|nr:RagB/SusD family nutrient uptake outer membrane protein [uncultured Bacteroides sp.]
MKHFKFKHIALLLAVASVPLYTACDFMDCSESDYYSKQQILDNMDRVKQLATQVYSYLPQDFCNTSGAMLDAATDDAVHVYESSAIQRFINGTWSANYTIDDVFANYYKAIHDANFYLENCVGLTFDEWKYSDGFADDFKSYQNYEHEVRFLRAFYYFELVKRYQNIPLITRTLTQEEANEASPTDATAILNFVIDECTDLADNKLPANYKNMPGGEGNLQRATKGMALALKSRATLYLASPLYAAGATDATQRWKNAAQAAYDLISESVVLGYGLDAKYSNLYGATNNQSKEVIMCRPTGTSTAFEAANFPMGVAGGKTTTCPTEDLVNAYEMNTGEAFSWSNAAQAADPYANRDPRLAMTVVYNGMAWPKNDPVEIFEGGKNGLPIKNATTTGYYLRKYVNNNVTFETGETTTSQHHNWILFRYAEILLNYAEAMVNAYGDPDYTGTYTLSARDAVNQVRARGDVQMPAYPAGMTKDAFLKRLKNERRVEFAFEGQRFWDLRRWKALDEMKTIHKVKVVKQADGTVSYTREPLATYTIDDKMYFYPIANTELFKNPQLVQNAGW